MNEFVTCAVCGKTCKRMTARHLQSHNMTMDQYRTQYPDAPIFSEAELASMAERNRATNQQRKGKQRPQEVKDKISETKRSREHQAWNKGKSRTDGQKRHASEVMKSKYESGEIVHWNLGKSTPESVRRRISETATHQCRTYSAEALLKRQQTLTAKKMQGWVPPGTRRKGIKVTDPVVLDKIKQASERTNAKRVKEGIAQINNICTRENLSILSIEDNYWVNMSCNTCGTEFTFTRQVFRPSKLDGKELCPKCYPRDTGSSGKEQELAEFVKSIYSGTIVQNDRKALNGKELDILLPQLGLAIEFNGLYWHSENVHSGHKHHLLYKQQYAYKNGIRVIHIYEDEWDNKRAVVESRLRHLLECQLYRIHARKCTIVQIDTQTKNVFLDGNHIMGRDVSGIRYGAYAGNELVAVMTFTPTNFVKGGDGGTYELNRFAVKCDYHIPGLASKIFKTFVRDYQPNAVISYCDRRWNAGESYTNMGFELVSTTPPNYWYMNDYKSRRHRSSFMKHIIVNDTNAHMTEWEIMQNMGYDRIWDCGTLKFVWIGDVGE